ncbi:hypothetical protein [Pseudomonas sp. DSP3-2-2]|uniref:hypothetical protein n=1 Tax=unclassified Pseudomonas TaxID=196821 RepID=UPI003CF2058F
MTYPDCHFWTGIVYYLINPCKAMNSKAYKGPQTPYPQKRQQSLGATLPGWGLICGKLLKRPYLAVDKQRFCLLGPDCSFFVQMPVGRVFKGLQRLANNLSTEAPTDFVGNC